MCLVPYYARTNYEGKIEKDLFRSEKEINGQNSDNKAEDVYFYFSRYLLGHLQRVLGLLK